MNIILDKLPSSVEIDGLQYPINTDFRLSMLFEMLMGDAEFDDREKIMGALNLYYPVMPFNKAEALRQALWFYQCGQEQKPQKQEPLKRPVYSYEHDGAYIYAAFMAQYGLDLQTAQLHWWQFRALFEGLNEDNLFVKIMGYRSMSISPKMPKEQAEFYRKMQKTYEIPLPKAIREKQSALEAALMGDGKVSDLL